MHENNYQLLDHTFFILVVVRNKLQHSIIFFSHISHFVRFILIRNIFYYRWQLLNCDFTHLFSLKVVRNKSYYFPDTYFQSFFINHLIKSKRKKRKSVVLTRAKIKIIFLQLDKKAVLNSYQNNCFPIINFNNQELMHHVHCLEYVFYLPSKTKEFFLSHKFLFYDLYFEFYSSNILKVFCLTKHFFIHCELQFQQHFYSHLLLFYTHYYQLPRMNTSLASIQQIPTNRETTCFIFHFANT